MKKKNKIFLITGCAGFIGFHLCNELLKNDKLTIHGIDNLNSYYDINLKKKRLEILKTHKNFIFKKIDITNKKKLEKIYKDNEFSTVIHLAAQAGVRYSIENPQTFFDNNLLGFYNILYLSAIYKISHFLFASSSSVYGENIKIPFNEKDNTDSPLSFYAATKKCNEIMAYSFSKIYNLKCSGLRFFTMYGPYGRPDMAPYIFLDSIIKNKKINLFNKGKNKRDFTYIDDGVNCITEIIYKQSKRIKLYELYNICASQSISTNNFLKNIELLLGRKSKTKKIDKVKADAEHTFGDNSKVNFFFNTGKVHSLQKGLEKFINWYNYYNIKK